MNEKSKARMPALVGLSAFLERTPEGGYAARISGAPGVVGRGATGEGALEDLERAALLALRQEAWFGGTTEENDGRSG